MTIAKLTSIVLDNPPTEDLVEADFQEIFGSELDLIPFPSEDPSRPDITLSQQQMTGFNTEISHVESISGPVLVTEVVTFPTGIEPPEGDLIRSTWGFQGAEPLGEEALLGTNVGAAIDNAGGTELGIPQPFNVFFSSQVKGVPGAANDFFIIDLIGDDGVIIRPIDRNGELIGNFSLELKSGSGEPLFDNVNLGDFGIVENFELTASSENLSNLGLAENVLIDDIPLAGIAFDIEDFHEIDSSKQTNNTLEGESQPLRSLAGFQITPLNLDDSISSADGSIDILAIGHNSLGTITKPDIIVNPLKAKFKAFKKALMDIEGRDLTIFDDSDDLINTIDRDSRHYFYSSGGDNLMLGIKDHLVGETTNEGFSMKQVFDPNLQLDFPSFVNSNIDRAIASSEEIVQFGITTSEIADAANKLTDSIFDAFDLTKSSINFEDFNFTAENRL